MASVIENQKATLHALFDAINRKDFQAVIDQRTAKCTHTVLPKSLVGEVRTNKEHKAWLDVNLSKLTDFKIDAILHEVHNADQHEAAVHTHAKSGETPVGVYDNEFVLFVKFTEDGKKITNPITRPSGVVEMIDSKYTFEFLGQMQAWAAENGVT